MGLKASDLRIGNFVYEPEGHLHIIETISEHDDRKRYPIPLTTEWLEKFGFEKRNKMQDCYKLDDYSVSFWASGATTFEIWLSEEEYEATRIKYVHQLQNLYFALTGEELTIKETVE